MRLIQPLIFLTLLLCTFISSAQVDTLNRTDANGERYGWWIVYLDDNLEEVTDTAEATHYHYTLYEGKFNYYNMGAIGTKKTPVIFPTSDTLETNGIKLLNGEYRSNYPNGQVRFILTVNQGVFTDYKEYFENGNLNTHFKYTPECGTPIHCCIIMYNKDGSLKFEGTNRVPGDQ